MAHGLHVLRKPQPEPNRRSILSGELITLSDEVDDQCMERTQGIEAARLLFENGLWFDGVVRGLVAELDYNEETAQDVARAALAERLHAEAGTSPHLR